MGDPAARVDPGHHAAGRLPPQLLHLGPAGRGDAPRGPPPLRAAAAPGGRAAHQAPGPAPVPQRRDVQVRAQADGAWSCALASRPFFFRPFFYCARNRAFCWALIPVCLLPRFVFCLPAVSFFCLPAVSFLIFSFSLPTFLLAHLYCLPTVPHRHMGVEVDKLPPSSKPQPRKSRRPHSASRRRLVGPPAHAGLSTESSRAHEVAQRIKLQKKHHKMAVADHNKEQAAICQRKGYYGHAAADHKRELAAIRHGKTYYDHHGSSSVAGSSKVASRARKRKTAKKKKKKRKGGGGGGKRATGGAAADTGGGGGDGGGGGGDGDDDDDDEDDDGEEEQEDIGVGDGGDGGDALAASEPQILFRLGHPSSADAVDGGDEDGGDVDDYGSPAAVTSGGGDADEVGDIGGGGGGGGGGAPVPVEEDDMADPRQYVANMPYNVGIVVEGGSGTSPPGGRAGLRHQRRGWQRG